LPVGERPPPISRHIATEMQNPRDVIEAGHLYLD
jgi:hypothetical protein